MKLTLSDKLGFEVRTKDKKTFKVKDFVFDEDTWLIRYLEVDMGSALSEQKILIPIQRVISEDWVKQRFNVDFNSKKLSTMPSLNQKRTVSRAYEAKLAKHFKTEEYWGRRYVPSMAPPSMGIPTNVFKPNQTSRKSGRIIKEDDIETSLRSFNEMNGYEVYSKNGKVGHIEDLLIESRTKEIISVIIQARQGLGYDKKIIVASQWIEEISYVERAISLNLTKSEVLDAPLFNQYAAINEISVRQELDYTGQPVNEKN